MVQAAELLTVGDMRKAEYSSADGSARDNVDIDIEAVSSIRHTQCAQIGLDLVHGTSLFI